MFGGQFGRLAQADNRSRIFGSPASSFFLMAAD
jgi:hypothetical protein